MVSSSPSLLFSLLVSLSLFAALMISPSEQQGVANTATLDFSQAE